MSQKEKTPGKELKKIETNNLPAKMFKTLIIRLCNKLRGRIDKLCENFNKVRKHKK